MSKPQLGIEEKLDIEGVEPIEIKEEKFDFSEDYDDDIQNDYKFIRTKIRRSIAICETILEESLKTSSSVNLASSPKTIDACSSIVKNMINAASELHKLHDKQIKLNKETKKVDSVDENGNTEKVPVSSLNNILKEIRDNKE